MSETPTSPRGAAPPGAKAPPGFKAPTGAAPAPNPIDAPAPQMEPGVDAPKAAAAPPGAKPPPGAKAPPGATAPKPAAPKPAPVAAPVAAVAVAPVAIAVKPAAPKPDPAKVAAAPAVAAAPVAPKSVSRREFLNYVWGASMALFLAQFGGISFLFAMPRFREGEVGGRFSQSVADFGYDANGLPNANNVGKFWMVKVDDTINAIYKVCTHLGCLYGWNSTGKIFACPCHGSQFAVDGKWIAGPAPRNLDAFKMQVLDASGNVIATSNEAGEMLKLPANADRIIVDTGAKISGKAHF